MMGLERALIELLLHFITREDLNAFLRSPQHTATLVGCLIAVCGALLGTFLLLRGLSLTSDAISHTVLLGIVLAFMLMTGAGLEGDTASPWLIVGAAAAGVGTVALTEALQRSGLVRQDAALGLAFPLLFAIAVILVSRFVDDVHLDDDAVLVGEIGLAWANTNSHCFARCESLRIRPEDPAAQQTRHCVNCRELNISPRDERAEFIEVCGNCGVYTPAQAWSAGLLDEAPALVFFPKSITVMLALTALTAGFVALFYKELKLTAFDAALAKSLGFRPVALTYALMILVSLVAVGAFDAVGSILVVAFFIIPPATAYLLTDRLSGMLLLGPILGGAGAFFGYDLARGWLFGIFPLAEGIAALNRLFGLQLPEAWDSSISASVVLTMFVIFLLAWILSPRYGLVASGLRRANSRRRFEDQVVLAHIHNHQDTPSQAIELRAATLHQHFRWTPQKMSRVLMRLRALGFVSLEAGSAVLTERGDAHVHAFRNHMLVAHNIPDIDPTQS
ncbi:MAG: metal ABC transporter permease [Chloroflexi bacterium]|nr:metal ABC transporter permease [Chloroflexota bacterium]MCY4248195.1 metal ABC transporter permease [Chloroflexota bacterium]